MSLRASCDNLLLAVALAETEAESTSTLLITSSRRMTETVNCQRQHQDDPTTRRLSELNPSSPSFFNQLRQEATEWQGPPDVNSTSHVFKVAVPNSTDVYRLAELKSFIPFSKSDSKALTPTGDGFAALLAVYHFNNIEKSPILNETHVSACKDLKITMSLYNSWYSEIETVRLFTEMIKAPKTFPNKPPAGVIGAYRSAVTLPLAILTGINDIPQISPASSAEDFDNKNQYPLFGRTVASAVDHAHMAVDFFTSIGSTHVACLYVTDTLGRSLSKAFQNAASEAGLQTIAVAISYYVQPGSTEMVQAIRLVAQSQYRHVYAVVFVDQLPIVMEEAIKQNVVGPNYFYLTPSIGMAAFNAMSINASDTALVKALSGVGILNYVGGVEDTRVFADLDPGSQMSSVYQRFINSWMAAKNDSDFVEFVRESLPELTTTVSNNNNNNDVSCSNTSEEDLGDTSTYGLLLYDAVTALALAMCNTPNNNEFFTGQEVYQEFLQTEFFGASGPIEFNNYTGTRLSNTINWGIWSTRFGSALGDGNASFTVTPAFHFADNQWNPINETPFVYADGSTVPPDSLPPVQINYNYIGTVGRVVGYTLMGITMLAVILSVCWFCYYGDEYIVYSAQPLFLMFVSVGALLMASAILPLGFEEMVVNDKEALSQACMAVPWLYTLGATFTLSALFSKIRGVHQAYINPSIETVNVTDFDLLAALGPLLLVNVILLTCWTAIAPLEWTRVAGIEQDAFGRIIDSYGMCTGPNDEAFLIPLAVVNLGFLVLCNWWAYTCRNIETIFKESSYIGAASAAMLQAWSMGIPIITVVSDSPPAKFYAIACIIFVTSLVTLSLVYIPKAIFLKRYLRAKARKKMLASYRIYQENQKPPTFDGANSSNLNQEDSRGLGTVENKPAALDLADSPQEDARKDPQDPLKDDNGDCPSSNNKSTAITAAEDTQNLSPVAANDDHNRSVSASFEAAHGGGDGSGGDGGAAPTQRRGSLLLLQQFARRQGNSGQRSWRTSSTANTGTKIIYNPRTQNNLSLTGGYEYSRKQAELLMQMDAEGNRLGESPCHEVAGEFQSGGGDGLPHVMKILEEEEDDNCPTDAKPSSIEV